MNGFSGLLILAVLVAFCVYSGYTIKCFQCNSYHQQDCGDWFDNRTHPLLPCPSGATMCRKIVQEVYYGGKWDIRYIRQCAKFGEVGANEGRDCKERVGTNKIKLRYCQCDNQEGCNAATTWNAKPLLLVAVLFLGQLVWTKL